MWHLTRRLLTLLLLGLALNQCSNKRPTHSGGDDIDTLTFVETPTDDFEAETAAYFLSGTRLAPQHLFDKIKTELDTIRAQHDSVPGVQVEYTPYHLTSELGVQFDSITTDSIRAGTYHAWDSLNDLYRLDSLHNWWRDYINLYFEGNQNPTALYHLYKDLPGLLGAGRWPKGGDWPMLLLKMEGQKIKYFFREAWGDCPSGCIYSRYNYFTVSAGTATFHGSFDDFPIDSTKPYPPWVDTALQAHRDYYGDPI